MTSNKAVGPMDIKNLLDLLNASEEGAAPGNNRETVLPLNESELGAEEVEQQEVSSATIAQADPGRRIALFLTMSGTDLRRISSMACPSARPNNCAQSQ